MADVAFREHASREEEKEGGAQEGGREGDKGVRDREGGRDNPIDEALNGVLEPEIPKTFVVASYTWDQPGPLGAISTPF